MDSSLETLTDAMANKNPIVQYIHQHKWKKVMKLLASKDGAKITTNKNHTGLTILAFAITHNPPLNVVEAMLKVNPSLILQEDSNGYLPLHIACANGCNSELIYALIRQDGNFAVSIPASINQRFPLHYTCLYILNPLWHKSSKMLSGGSIRSDEEPNLNGTYHKKNIIRRTRNYQEVISLKSKDSKSTIMTLKHEDFEDQLLVLRKLISIAPHVLNARDKYGYAPIDYFQDFLAENVDVSPRSERCDIVSNVLRKESIKLYKTMKTKVENENKYGYVHSKNIPSNGEVGLESDCICGALSQPEIEAISFNRMGVN